MTPNLREKLNSQRKIYFKDILPSKQYIHGILTTCKSDISLKEYNNKLYEDPFYSIEAPLAKSSYAVLNGEWEIDEESDDVGNEIVKLIDNKSGQYIKIAFPNHIEKIKFLNELNVSKPIVQLSNGINLKGIINNNLIENKKKINFIKPIYGTIGVLIVGFFIKNIIKSQKYNSLKTLFL